MKQVDQREVPCVAVPVVVLCFTEEIRYRGLELCGEELRYKDFSVVTLDFM